MNHFKNYVCAFLGAAAFLVFSGCGVGGGVREDALPPVNEDQIRIVILSANSPVNWHGTLFETYDIRTAFLEMTLFNEKLFSSSGYNPLSGRFFGGYPISEDNYLGEIAFERGIFTPTVDIGGQYYFGAVEVETSWIIRTDDAIADDETILITNFEDIAFVFSSGKWYDVPFSFTINSDSSVGLIFEYEERNITFQN